MRTRMNVDVVPLGVVDEQFDDFIELPWRIYPNTHKWVPPLKATIREQLSEQNLFFRHGQAQPFVAMVDGQVCGRIVASIDMHQQLGLKAGFFGYLEMIDNLEVCRALLDAAHVWLAERGITTVYGPFDLNIYTGYRLQIDGFDTEPFFGEPRHPPYYVSLLAQYGYTQHIVWKSYDFELQAFELLLKYLTTKLQETFKAESPYCYSHFDLGDFENKIAMLHPLVMKAFGKNFAFAELDFSEFMQRFAFLRELVLSETLIKTTHKNTQQLVGFSYSYQNYADAFRQINGEMDRIHELHKCNSDTVIAHTLAVHPEHRHGEVTYRLMYEIVKNILQLQHRYKFVIAALIKDDGTPNFFDMIAKPSRHYAIFQHAM